MCSRKYCWRALRSVTVDILATVRSRSSRRAKALAFKYAGSVPWISRKVDASERKFHSSCFCAKADGIDTSSNEREITCVARSQFPFRSVTDAPMFHTIAMSNSSLLVAAVVLTGLLLAAAYPQSEVSNGQIRPKVNLPDAQKGYYRGTRFDWSGVIASLEYKSHTYFEPFYERFDPNVRDVDLKNGVVAGPISATSGPVDEFGGADGATQGYAEAKPGGTFIKIGVGVLRKPDDPKYDHYYRYEIADPGKWTVKKGPGWVQFTQEVNDRASADGYADRKTVRLVQGKPETLP